MHSYGGEAGNEGAAQNSLSWKFFERMRKKWAEEKTRKVNVKAIDPQATECIQWDSVHGGGDAKINAKLDDLAKFSNKQSHEDAPDKRLSRKRLREELHEQAKESRQKLYRRGGTEVQGKPMPIKARIQGNDAITRLINAGRSTPREGPRCGKRIRRD